MAGKEDPVELDSSQTLRNDLGDKEDNWEGSCFRIATTFWKYQYS